MKSVVHASDLSHLEKRLLFWASFLSLTAAGFGFAFRVALGGDYGAELGLDKHQIGQIFGASLWPIALTMIGFSLIVDRTGYKAPMFGAFALQAISGIGTYFANSYGTMYAFALCAGLGHGIVEAVINPICAAVYPKEKTKWLTILHAAWPAGLAFGTLFILGADALVDGGLGWRVHAMWIVVPAIAYVLMYIPCKFPVDERVQAGVPYMEMLRQVGFLSAFLASFLMIYEIGNQLRQLGIWTSPPDAWIVKNWFGAALILGGVIGTAFGLWVKSLGRPLFFLMCLLMIPIATAELGTDGWIKGLMTPVLEGISVNAAFALVFSAAIMLVFRVFAGGILKWFSPPGLLCVSGLFSAVGLYWLSGATGAAIFVAFVIYALGQTYYWPCVLGFVSERYPRGGALTLNTVSAIGLLSAGIIGTQILGVQFDKSIHDTVAREAPALARATEVESSFLGLAHQTIVPERKDAFLAGIADATIQPDKQANYKKKGVAIEAAYVAGVEDAGTSKDLKAIYARADEEAGRDVLQFSAIFPTILLVVFGMIALYFRSRGGYKPIELLAEVGPDSEAEAATRPLDSAREAPTERREHA